MSTPFSPDPARVAALRRLMFTANKPALTVDDLAGGRRQLPYEEVEPIGRLAAELLEYLDGPGARPAGTPDPREFAALRGAAGTLYARLQATMRRLSRFESVAGLEIELAKLHVELGRLGVV